jgi:hypothetical protein
MAEEGEALRILKAILYCYSSLVFQAFGFCFPQGERDGKEGDRAEE